MSAAPSMQALTASSGISGGNAAYLENLYEAYLQNPKSVSDEWCRYFEELQRGTSGARDVSHAAIRDYFQQLALIPNHKLVQTHKSTLDTQTQAEAEHIRKHAQVARLIQAYQAKGHLQANINPIPLAPVQSVPELEISYYDLTDNDLDTLFTCDTGFLDGCMSLRNLIAALKQTYCGTIGIEYQHMTNLEESRWLAKRLESIQSTPNFSKEQRLRILNKLTAAEGLEKILGNKYVGQTRFSLEGGDSFIPLLDALIQHAGSEQGVKEIAIGMAHRGRVNVLVNVFGKKPSDLMDEFEGRYKNKDISGDVKYHKGFYSDIKTGKNDVHVILAFNPSHLEIVSPVVAGSVKARQDRIPDGLQKVLPITVHGDASFAGQGVVMETLNLSQLRGYNNGGTIRVIINNQVGFTISNPRDARSTLYCTDVAKMLEAPIFHVNGDDPEAVVLASQIALDYRMKFNKDAVIDLVCYRRLGHNEADEPSFTQPVMYQKIRNHPTTLQLYVKRLEGQKIITASESDALMKTYYAKIDNSESVVPELITQYNDQWYGIDWSSYKKTDWRATAKTSVEARELKRLSDELNQTPKNFNLHPQLKRFYEARIKMSNDQEPINWGYAETLAYATLLRDGFNIRLAGEDSGRGTFSHRHARLDDSKTGQEYVPLAALSDAKGHFTVIDSILSEEAVLAYEYGYASTDPHTLVIWEAQYGDFANGAQMVIDQFISSSEQKWGLLCGLVMFLPHGHEGKGPEHTSARPERYLQLCAQNNMQVCYPSTPAQLFHMLRRQMLRPYRKPLIVLTPKSMLRHKLVISTLADLTDGQFSTVLPEIDEQIAQAANRVILCSGRVYYDLLQERQAQKSNVALIRVEQLYPFPAAELSQVLAQYSSANEVIWCQEEPKNQGAWQAIRDEIQQCLLTTQTLTFIGRPEAAAPAVGYLTWHQESQMALVKEALGCRPPA